MMYQEYMTRISTLLIIALASIAATAGEASTSDRTAQVVATQAARFQAMLNADVATINDILADDLVYAHTTGKIVTKASLVENIGSGAVDYQKMELTDSNVRIFGDVAVITGSANMQVNVGDRINRLSIRFIEVYVAKDSHWQLVSWQSTRVP